MTGELIIPSSCWFIGDYAFYNTSAVVCPYGSHVYELLTGNNYTRYRSSTTEVIGIVSSSNQLMSVFKAKNNNSVLSTGSSKSKAMTGASS